VFFIIIFSDPFTVFNMLFNCFWFLRTNFGTNVLVTMGRIVSGSIPLIIWQANKYHFANLGGKKKQRTKKMFYNLFCSSIFSRVLHLSSCASELILILILSYRIVMTYQVIFPDSHFSYSSK